MRQPLRASKEQITFAKQDLHKMNTKYLYVYDLVFEFNFRLKFTILNRNIQVLQKIQRVNKLNQTLLSTN